MVSDGIVRYRCSGQEDVTPPSGTLEQLEPTGTSLELMEKHMISRMMSWPWQKTAQHKPAARVAAVDNRLKPYDGRCSINAESVDDE